MDVSVVRCAATAASIAGRDCSSRLAGCDVDTVIASLPSQDAVVAAGTALSSPPSDAIAADSVGFGSAAPSLPMPESAAPAASAFTTAAAISLATRSATPNTTPSATPSIGGARFASSNASTSAPRLLSSTTLLGLPLACLSRLCGLTPLPPFASWLSLSASACFLPARTRRRQAGSSSKGACS